MIAHLRADIPAHLQNPATGRRNLRLAGRRIEVQCDAVVFGATLVVHPQSIDFVGFRQPTTFDTLHPTRTFCHARCPPGRRTSHPASRTVSNPHSPHLPLPRPLTWQHREGGGSNTNSIVVVVALGMYINGWWAGGPAQFPIDPLWEHRTSNRQT